ncbi:MAG: hypothetical protein WC584_02025 [Candidatus Pacearchaeota archaeon]
MKGVIILLSFLILVSVVSASSDVAYILKNTAKPDAGFLDVFHEMDLSVDLIDDNNIKNTNFANYDLIFIGNEKVNSKLIPKNKPVILANKYLGKYFNFIDKGNINQFASNFPLDVFTEDTDVSVYEVSESSPGKVNLYYYYVPTKNKKQNIESVATTNTKYKNELGDVIAYSNEGTKKCFFGIVETKYWTDDAEDLFKDCIEFVVGGAVPGNQTNNQTETNETMIHDVGINKNYTNSINGVRIQELENDSYLLDEVSELVCNKKYKIDFKTENLGDFTENISFLGIFGNYNWTTDKKNLIPSSFTTAGSKTINISFSPGNYIINISAVIDNDANLGNNFAFRNVKVVCGGQNQSQQNQTQTNETLIHDVGIVGDYTNSINGIRIQNDETNQYLINDSKLTCNKKYIVSYKTMNYGNFTENIIFTGTLANFNWTSTKTNLTSGTSTTTGSKTINMTFVPGNYAINIFANIFGDNNLSDNSASRNVEIVCGQ